MTDLDDLDDLDDLERGVGPPLRLALRERAAMITGEHQLSVARLDDDRRSPSRGRGAGSSLDGGCDIVVFEVPASDPTTPDTERVVIRRPTSHGWVAAVAAIVVVVLLMSVLRSARDDDRNLPAGPATPPSVATTDEDSSTSSIADDAATGGLVTSELVASFDLWGWDIADLMLVYVYADGRVISTGTGGRDDRGWVERRLTPEGVALVQSDLVATGLFDPDDPAGHGGTLGDAPPTGRCSFSCGVVVRVDEHLAVADGPRVVDLVDVFSGLDAWLPPAAWAEREPTAWVPDGQTICLQPTNGGGERDRRGVLDDPEGVIRDLPEPAATILEDAEPLPPAPPRSPLFTTRPRQPDCYGLRDDAARAVSESLDQAVLDHHRGIVGGSREYTFDAGPPTSERVGIGIAPMLPHGQPAEPPLP